MKKEKKIIGISLLPEIMNKLEDGKYNRSKLIDSLLTNYFKNKPKKKS